MKTATSLFLTVVLILAPVFAIGKRTEPMTQAEFDAQCKAEGGCFVVTENGFKNAMVIAFDKGYDIAKQECRGAK